MTRVLVCLLLFSAFALRANAETIMLPMRDGTRLATDFYLPTAGGPAFPAVLIRSVYGRNDPAMNDRMVERLTKIGIAVVTQDTRGHGDSEGTRMAFSNDGWGANQDGVDTVNWLKSQPWCNGRIGTYGTSALGITQVLLAPATSSIACQAITMAPSNFYGVFMAGGVPRKQLSERYAKMMGHEAMLAQYRSHPSYDEFWSYYNAQARAADITAPAVFGGGWFDIYPQGIIDNFTSRQYDGGEGARGNQKLVIGPWTHRISQDAGQLRFPDNYRFDFQGLFVQFFRHWLLGEQNGVMDSPAVHYYVMGDVDDPNAPGNEWRTADKWPPYEEELSVYFLQSDRTLRTKPEDDASPITYVFDPANPCPTLGGTNAAGINGTLPSGAFDQRPNVARPDVLAFESEVTAEPLEITGRVTVRLYVSTDAPDTDFSAILVDIYPDGRQMGIASGIHRLKYRDGFKQPDPLPSGELGTVQIDLWSTSIIVNKGHKIGLHISSSNWPRNEVNPNTGADLPSYTGESEAGDRILDPASVRAARNTVYMGHGHPSGLILPIRIPAQD